MDFADARRFIRHVALPEVGSRGQQRILDATVALVVDAEGTLALETATLYLACAGVRAFRVLLPAAADASSLAALAPAARFDEVKVASAGSAWAAALAGCDVALRASFADDSFVEACRRLRVPAVVARWRKDSGALDLLSLRPAPGGPDSDVPSVPPGPSHPQSDVSAIDHGTDVLAGTLAATEVLWSLLGRGPGVSAEAAATGVIRHLNVPFSTRENHPITHNIAWPAP